MVTILLLFDTLQVFERDPGLKSCILLLSPLLLFLLSLFLFHLLFDSLLSLLAHFLIVFLNPFLRNLGLPIEIWLRFDRHLCLQLLLLFSELVLFLYPLIVFKLILFLTCFQFVFLFLDFLTVPPLFNGTIYLLLILPFIKSDVMNESLFWFTSFGICINKFCITARFLFLLTLFVFFCKPRLMSLTISPKFRRP